MSGTRFDALARSCASFEWEKPGKSDGLLAKVKSVRRRIARLVRELGLHRVMPLKFRVTIDSDHKHPIAKNVFDRKNEASRAEPEMDYRYHVLLLGERGLGVLLDGDGPLVHFCGARAPCTSPISHRQ